MAGRASSRQRVLMCAGTAEAAEDRGGLLWDEWPKSQRLLPPPPFGTFAVSTCALRHLRRLAPALFGTCVFWDVRRLGRAPSGTCAIRGPVASSDFTPLEFGELDEPDGLV